MAASRFFGDALRSASVTFNMIALPLMGSFSRTFSGAFGLVNDRSEAERCNLIFRIWPATFLLIPSAVLLSLIAAGQKSGFEAFLVFVGCLISIYPGVFAAGLVAGVIDRISTSIASPSKKAVKAGNVPAQAFLVPENLKDILAEKIRGQDLALEELSAAVTTSARNYTFGKPLGMYLLVGATGSGKTETAKQLSAALGWPMYREECNQYATQHSITRLIGAAAGYKESELGGSLTNALRSAPHGILLLDEIEKAHPSVSRVLMTLADEGTITTGLGEVVDARGWLILATSNASQAEIVKIVETPKMRSFERIAAVKKALAEHWPAEIIARMRSVVPYKPVSADAMRRVFEDMMVEICHQSGGTDEHLIHIEDAAIDLLSEAYASLRQYGVREMRSFIDRDLGLPLMKIFEGDDLEVVIDADGDKLIAYPRASGPKRKAAVVKGILSKIGFGAK